MLIKLVDAKNVENIQRFTIDKISKEIFDTYLGNPHVYYYKNIILNEDLVKELEGKQEEEIEIFYTEEETNEDFEEYEDVVIDFDVKDNGEKAVLLYNKKLLRNGEILDTDVKTFKIFENDIFYIKDKQIMKNTEKYYAFEELEVPEDIYLFRKNDVLTHVWIHKDKIDVLGASMNIEHTIECKNSSMMHFHKKYLYFVENKNEIVRYNLNKNNHMRYKVKEDITNYVVLDDSTIKVNTLKDVYYTVEESKVKEHKVQNMLRNMKFIENTKIIYTFDKVYTDMDSIEGKIYKYDGQINKVVYRNNKIVLSVGKKIFTQ